MEIKTYYIGGSPCSGKTTLARFLAEQTGGYHLETDELLGKYALQGVKMGWPACQKQWAGTPDEIWLGDWQQQCEQELAFYREIFAFLQEDLRRLKESGCITFFEGHSQKVPHQVLKNGLIVEGAVLLPELMKRSGVLRSRYICIASTREFQTAHYQKREWVSEILKGCSDKKQAFSNWMERDALFADRVQKQCEEEAYPFVRIREEKQLQEMKSSFFSGIFK